MKLRTIFLVVAVVLLVWAALPIGSGKVRVGWLGAAFLAASFLV